MIDVFNCQITRNQCYYKIILKVFVSISGNCHQPLEPSGSTTETI